MVRGAILLAAVSVSASLVSSGRLLHLLLVATVVTVASLSRGTVASLLGDGCLRGGGLLRDSCLSSDLVAVLVLGHVTGFGSEKSGFHLFLGDTVSAVPFDVKPVVA